MGNGKNYPVLTVESSMTRWSMPGKSINFNGGAVNQSIAM
jgi:hypothetical protein